MYNIAMYATEKMYYMPIWYREEIAVSRSTEKPLWVYASRIGGGVSGEWRGKAEPVLACACSGRFSCFATLHR